MGFFHIFGVLAGVFLLAISRMFWLNVCFSIAEAYDTLNKTTCGAFETFFFWIGILLIVISLIGFFRK